ncbi:MAG: AI-2E family transporter, partial [Candidatus Ventricola sp.]
MQEDRKTIYLRLLVEIVCAAAAVALAALLGRSVLGIMLPFILAFTMAWALNPVIQILQRRLRLTRKLFSYILVLLIYAVLGVLAFVFVTQMIGQLIDLVGAVPSIVAQMQKAYNALMQYVLQLLDMLPPGYEEVRQEVLSLFATAWDWLRSVITRLVSGAVGITSGVAMEVPSFVIFLTVLILASCIITTDFPNLRENIYAYLGSRGKHSLRLMGHSFRTAVLGFFRSQLIFALVDMAI